MVQQSRSEFAEVEPSYRSPEQADAPSGLFYTYLGRARAHTAPIVSVHFGVRDLAETLISVGADRS